MDKINKKIINKTIALAAFLVVFTVLTVLKNNEAVCEFFATTFARGWIFLFGHIFGWLPFSVYELFLVAVILSALAYVVFIIRFLVKKRFKKALSFTMTAALAVAVFLTVYTAAASMSYNRAALDIKLYNESTDGKFTYEQALALAEKTVDELNAAYLATDRDADGNVVYPYTFKEISDMIAAEYSKITSAYFSAYTPPAKKIINKRIMSEMHIVGVFFAPTGEANINGNETSYDLPHTMAHEMAHSKGVMRESDANLMAKYVLLQSEDPYLRYSGLMASYGAALSLVGLYPDSSADIERISAKAEDGIAAERMNSIIFWSQFTVMNDIGSFFNDIYLKLNGQSGTDSYHKPPVISGTGQMDGDGNEIVDVISYSDTQSLLISLFLDGAL